MSFLDALAGLALPQIVRGSLLIAGVAAIAPLLRWCGAGAETRRALWASALAALVVLAAVGPWVPRRAVVLPGQALIGEVERLAFPEPSPKPVADALPAPVLRPRDREREPAAPAVADATADLAALARRGIGLAWLLGALGVGGTMLARRASRARMAARARRVEDPDVLDLLDQASRRMGIDRPIRLLEDRAASVPMTWGTLRPAILLPRGAGGWPTSRLECVLLHELAHVRRRDSMIQAIGRWACALHWWNPLVWVAAARLREEAETLCDADVVAAGVPPSRYAGALVDVLETVVVVPGPGVRLARAGGFERRVRDVLGGGSPRARRGIPAIVASAVLIAGVVAASAVPVRTNGAAPGAGPAPLVDALVAALDDPVPFVRRSAINGLRDVGDPEGIEAVRRVLDDPDPDVRRAAEEVLGLTPARPNKDVPTPRPPPLDGAALESALAALRSPDPRLRERAAGRLQAARDPRAVTALAAALGDPDEHVRRQAAESLGWIADPAATRALVEASRDTDPYVRLSAVGALGRIGGSPRTRESPRPDTSSRGEPVELAAATSARGPRRGDDRTAGPATGPAACRPPDQEAPEATAESEIRTLLTEPDPGLRERAGWALGVLVPAGGHGPSAIVGDHLEPKDASEALASALYDPSRAVRLAAACSLARMGDGRALEHLERRARDPEAEIAAAAKWAIRRIREREVGA